MAEPLLDRTHDLLASRRDDLTLVQIAEDTELDYSWLSKFAQGRIPNPGVSGVQTLHDYLERDRQRFARRAS